VFLAVVFAGVSACGGASSPAPIPAAGVSDGQSQRDLASPVNVVKNPGFEMGFQHWRQCGTVAAAIGRVAHSGAKSARLGTFSKPEIKGDAAICQSVTVPFAARFTFWIESVADVSTSREWQSATLLSASGVVLQSFYRTAASSKVWKKLSYDLSAYAGRNVTIEFEVHGAGSKSGYIGQYVDDVSLVATGSPSPSPSPTASASPTTSPSTPPTTGPTSSPTAEPTNGATPCSQPQAAGQAASVVVVPFTAVTSAISSGHQVCLSAYVFTSAMFSALDSAARSGAKVTVVLPNEERSDDSDYATELAEAGATIVWDPGAPTDHPLHAKMAVVDGVAYLDGRNWDTTDVTISDGVAADFTAIENALNLNPTSSPNLDTVKSLAIAREDAFINGSAPAAGITVQFMSESFGSDANTVAALESAAAAGATVQVIVLASDESGNSGEAAALTAMQADGVQVRLNPGEGSEKMTLISNQSTAWFGSANATTSSSTTYNYIDWGMTVTNPAVISSLQSYFTSTWSASTPY
jgi:PLD-like domain